MSLAKRIAEGSIPVPFSGCWVWLGCVDGFGYGAMSVHGKKTRAHRAAYEAFVGKADGHVCHSCDTPSCVNPSHLFLGTHSDNMRDMVSKGRGNKPTGSRNSRFRFSDVDVSTMRKMRESGSSLREIADAFGMKSTGYASMVTNKKVRI